MQKFVVVALMLVVSSQARSPWSWQPPPKNIIQVANELGASRFISLLMQGGLAGTLAGPGPFTVFAPTNAAFFDLDSNALTALYTNKAYLRDVLKYHVVSGNVMSSNLTNELLVDTLEGAQIRFNIYGEDRKQIITAEGSEIISADNTAANGVIHVVDEVLVNPKGTNVDNLIADPKFSTLVTAVSIAGLIDTLNGTGPFTIFAPTNAAFAKIPDPDLVALLADTDALTSVLMHHVLDGTLYSAGLENGQEAETLDGDDVTVRINARGVFVDQAKVIGTDLSGTNGVVHTIDTVMLPPPEVVSTEATPHAATPYETADVTGDEPEDEAEDEPEVETETLQLLNSLVSYFQAANN